MYMRSVRAKGKHTRCITCITDTQIITQTEKSCLNQVVSIQHGEQVEMMWGAKTTTACCKDVVAYDDGTIKIMGEVIKVDQKVTGVVWIGSTLWVA